MRQLEYKYSVNTNKMVVSWLKKNLKKRIPNYELYDSSPHVPWQVCDFWRPSNKRRILVLAALPRVYVLVVNFVWQIDLWLDHLDTINVNLVVFLPVTKFSCDGKASPWYWTIRLVAADKFYYYRAAFDIFLAHQEKRTWWKPLWSKSNDSII